MLALKKLNFDRRPYAAEFIGTFIFACVSILSIIASAAFGLTSDGSTRILVAFTQGGTIALMVSLFGSVSGGHFNPCVTFAVLLAGKLDIHKAVIYMLCQLSGACLAALLVYIYIAEPLIDLGSNLSREVAMANLGVPSVAKSLLPLSSFVFVEILLTTILVLAVLRNAIEQKFPPWAAGIFIGGAVFLDVLAGGPFTGAAMNPARWFGPAFLTMTWDNHFVYWLAPFMGAFLGYLLNQVVSENSDI